MTKKRAVAKRKVAESGNGADDPIQDIFDVPDPGPEPKEGEDDGVQREAKEEGQEEVAPKKKLEDPLSGVDERLEDEPPAERIEAESEVVETEIEAETTPSPEELLAKVKDEHRLHEEGLRKEITRLRTEVQDLRRRTGQVQAPAPQQATVQPQGQAIPDRFGEYDYELGDDGKIRMTAESRLRQLADTKALIEEQTRPDPNQLFLQQLQMARSNWVAENPSIHGPAAQRIEQAVDYLQLLSEHYARSTGHQPPDIFEWVNTIETGTIGQQFRSQFPEIEDIGGLIDAAFTGSSPEERVWKIRRYMQSYVKSQKAPTDGSGTAKSSAADEGATSGARESETGIVKLQASKPRSMAEKGRSIDKGTTDEQEYLRLLEEIGRNPIGTTDDPDYKRAQQLARKLGIEMNI